MVLGQAGVRKKACSSRWSRKRERTDSSVQYRFNVVVQLANARLAAVVRVAPALPGAVALQRSDPVRHRRIAPS